MRSRAVAIGAAVVAVAGLVAVGLLVWPGLPDDGDPYRQFRAALQSPSEVVALLGDPDVIERNCWDYLDRGAVDELRVCFGPKGRVAWAAKGCETRAGCASPASQAEAVLDDELPVEVNDAFFDSSSVHLALTTPDGERIFVSDSKQPGAHCLTVEDTAHTVSTTCAPFNGTPVGNAIVQGFQDEKTRKVKLAVMVPDGFDTAILAGEKVPIENNAVVLEVPEGVTSFVITGPAGTDTITNFGRLLGALKEKPAPTS